MCGSGCLTMECDSVKEDAETMHRGVTRTGDLSNKERLDTETLFPRAKDAER